MINNNNTDLRYVVILRPDGIGRVLTLSDANIRRTLDFEIDINKSTFIGEYSNRDVAAKAAKQAERGGRPLQMRQA